MESKQNRAENIFSEVAICKSSSAAAALAAKLTLPIVTDSGESKTFRPPIQTCHGEFHEAIQRTPVATLDGESPKVRRKVLLRCEASVNPAA